MRRPSAPGGCTILQRYRIQERNIRVVIVMAIHEAIANEVDFGLSAYWTIHDPPGDQAYPANRLFELCRAILASEGEVDSVWGARVVKGARPPLL